jgi:spore maturation protein CgeB
MEAGHNCDCFDISCETLDFDESVKNEILKYLGENPADIVFTFNFSPTVSAACNSLSIPYAAWIYDCPLQSLYHKEAYNDINHFFVFDKYLLDLLKTREMKNAYYMPLAANVTKMGKLQISLQDERDYSCDISFVGIQYVDGRYAFYKNSLPEHLQNELDLAAYEMLGKWDGRDHIHNTMSDELIDALADLSEITPYEKLNFPNRLYFEEVVIARAVAYTERRLMMEAISDFSPRWYGAKAEDKDKIDGVCYCPSLDYQGSLPKAYNLSRINLSTCLHSISSGIPLRVFDIMGAGGFILSNHQPEIEELFDIGKEIVVYHSFEEMRELAKFFLSHEDARMAILLAGYEKVCNEFTYPVAVQKMIERVFS